MKKLAIIGASGHGKVIADIAKKNGYTDIVLCSKYYGVNITRRKNNLLPNIFNCGKS